MPSKSSQRKEGKAALVGCLFRFKCEAHVAYWHEPVMAQQSLHVCYWGNGGRHLLPASISSFALEFPEFGHAPQMTDPEGFDKALIAGISKS